MMKPVADHYAVPPAPLVLYREVLNWADVYRFGLEHGITRMVRDLHVTIATARTPVDWSLLGDLQRDQITVEGEMGFKRLGHNAWCLGLSDERLYRRWLEVRSLMPIDYPDDYKCHVTVLRTNSFDATLRYRGKLVFGPERVIPFVAGMKLPRPAKLDSPQLQRVLQYAA